MRPRNVSQDHCQCSSESLEQCALLLHDDLSKSAIARRSFLPMGNLHSPSAMIEEELGTDRAGRWSPAQRVQATLLSIIGSRALTSLSGLVGRQIAGTVAFSISTPTKPSLQNAKIDAVTVFSLLYTVRTIWQDVMDDLGRTGMCLLSSFKRRRSWFCLFPAHEVSEDFGCWDRARCEWQIPGGSSAQALSADKSEAK